MDGVGLFSDYCTVFGASTPVLAAGIPYPAVMIQLAQSHIQPNLFLPA